MSKASKVRSKSIENIQQLSDWLESGCTPANDLLIGTENEKIIFDTKTFNPPAYKDKKGNHNISELLKGLSDQFGWKKVDEYGKEIDDQGVFVGLIRDEASISLEPAGQLELSGAPLKTVHETAEELDQHLLELDIVGKDLGLDLIGLGYHPTHNKENMPIMPKSRYKLFQDYFIEKQFTGGLEMLFCTNTVQVNLGFSSEEDMVKKLRVGLSLQPIVAALFANSPFLEGKPSGYLSYRSHLNHNLLGGRYGFMLPVAFDDDFGFEKYTEFALKDIPLLGVYRGGEFKGADDALFSEFMEGKLKACPGDKATMSDWVDHLNCIWPEVRLRQFLEMRGADCGPAEMIKALPALWVGLLYDDTALDQAYEMVKDWTEEDRDYLRTMTPLKALDTPFMGTKVKEIAQNCLALSEQGLKNRAIQNKSGVDESVYLAPLHEIAGSGRTLAQRLLDKYDNEWKGDLKHLFNQYSFRANSSVLTLDDPTATFTSSPLNKNKPNEPKK